MNTLYQNAHSSERDAVNVLQYLDVAFVVIGAIAALILGAPAFGVIVGAAGWLLQRSLQVIDRRLTARIEDSLQARWNPLGSRRSAGSGCSPARSSSPASSAAARTASPPRS